MQDEDDDEDPFSEDGRSRGSAPPTARAVVAYRLATTVLELALPTVGACSKFLSAKGFVHTLESHAERTVSQLKSAICSGDESAHSKLFWKYIKCL